MKKFKVIYHDFNNFSIVKSNKKYNFINKQYKLLSDVWFDYVFSFYYGFGRVVENKKWNFINKNGKFMLCTWVDNIYQHTDKYYIISLNEKYNVFDITLKKYLSEQWFDYINVVYHKPYMFDVKINNKCFKININSNIIHFLDG